MTDTSGADTKVGVAVLGGSFDPVHCGHLRIAIEVFEALDLKELRFIPAAQNPHRDPPIATATQRLAMLQAAVEDSPFVIDDREIIRGGPSYTVDTLQSIRSELPTATPLCMIVGMDAFASFNRWERWREILEISHIVVARRPHAEVISNQELDDLLAHAKTESVSSLRTTPAGRILFLATPMLDISSTDIRERARARRNLRFLVPDGVRHELERADIYAGNATT